MLNNSSITFLEPIPAVDKEPSNSVCSCGRLSETKELCCGELQERRAANNLYAFF